jgi:hypothetical protein
MLLFNIKCIWRYVASLYTDGLVAIFDAQIGKCVKHINDAHSVKCHIPYSIFVLFELWMRGQKVIWLTNIILYLFKIWLI